MNLEAMAAGKAVIASRTGGAREIVIDGETGMLTEPGDAEALANALRTLAGNKSLCARLGEAGYLRAASGFTWESMAHSYRGIYERALVATRQPHQISGGMFIAREL